jgi:CubicO group peptidase (beta-lactamase class C family)
MDVDVDGTCDQRFAKVRDTFVESFTERGDVGASVAVTFEGELVVDLWGGTVTGTRTGRWQRDTMVNTFSTTKGMTALCAHLLIDRGDLDVDAPVVRYWPEFGQAGKSEIPVRWLLSHRAGLSALREPLPTEALFDWDRMCDALARSEPWWEPGSASGYHAMTFGFLVGEVVRRITGLSLGTFFRREIAEPLDVDFWIGLPEAEHDRVADLIVPPGGVWPTIPAGAHPSVRAMHNPPMDDELVNSVAWRSAELPAANGHGTARALARVYGALANGGAIDGVRLVRPEAIERMREPQPEGVDLFIGLALGGVPFRWNLGFMPNILGVTYGPNPRAFGHTGHGGSVAMCDPESRLSVAYVMNRMQVASEGRPPDTRGVSLIHAATACATAVR